MIYDPIGYQAVWFPALYRTAGSTSTLWCSRALYSRTLLDALFGLPWQLKFFSSRHGCSFAASLSPCSSFSISSRCFRPPPAPPFSSASLSYLSLFLLPSFTLFRLSSSPSVRRRVSRCPTRYARAIKSACLPRTFTRSLTPGSAGVKGTDVLA